MTDDFSKFEQMKRSGASAEEVFLEAVRDRIDPISRIRLIRAVFSLTPGQAKEIIVRAEGEAASLDQHQANIAKKLTEGSPSPSD
jgi:hypothetical protein